LDLFNKPNNFGLKKNTFAWNYISLGIAFAEYVDSNKDFKVFLSIVVPFRKYITGLISLGLLIHRLSKNIDYLSYHELMDIQPGINLKRFTGNQWYKLKLLECTESFIKTIESKDYNKKRKQPPAKSIILRKDYDHLKYKYVLDQSSNTKSSKEKINNLSFVKNILSTEEIKTWESSIGLVSLILTHREDLLIKELNDKIFLTHSNHEGSINDLILLKKENQKGNKWTNITTSKVKDSIDEFDDKTIVLYDMDRSTNDWDINDTELIKKNSIITLSHPWTFNNTKESLRIQYNNSENIDDTFINSSLDNLKSNIVNFTLFKVLK